MYTVCVNLTSLTAKPDRYHAQAAIFGVHIEWKRHAAFTY